MQLRTLGRLTLDGADFPYPKLLLLLTYLSLAGPQPRRRLAALFWPRATDSRNRLSVTLSRIQKKLPGVVTSGERVSTSLAVDAATVGAALAAGRHEAAIAAYGGHFLDGVALTGVSEELTEWVLATGDDLARAVQHAHLALAEGLASEDRFRRAAVQAEAALAVGDASLLDPADLTRLHTLLVAGGSPRAADARSEAETFELDLAMSQQQARARLRLAGRVRSGAAAADDPPAPRAATLLLGRERELDELARYLHEDDHRLITLIGPGGIGKSRLAQQAAAEAAATGGYASRTAFVRLEEVAQPQELPAALADALGVVVPAGESPLGAVQRVLAGGRFLLALDNFEHLVDAAPQLLALLERCPELRLLVTSREPLAVAAEWQVRVEGLRYPTGPELHEPDAASWPALALFEARARRVDHRFSIGQDDLAAVSAICRACLGSPLALELAASWVGAMSPADIVEEMTADADFLDDPRRAVAARHRSIRSVFEHSWRLLTDAERALFRRLAVFRGGFDRQAARVVAGADAHTLAGLVSKSFVVRRTARRYERHPLLSRFALEKLAADPAEHASMSERHARYMRGLALMAHPHLLDPAGAAWRERLDQEQANLALALAWARDAGDANMLLDMIEAQCDFWVWRGFLDDALGWTRAVVALGAGETDPRRYLLMLMRTTFLCVVHGDYDSPGGLLDEGLALAREIGSAGEEARLWSNRGVVAVYRGDHAAARAHYERALELAEGAGRPDVVARVLNNLGDLHAFGGQHAEARPLYHRSLELERRLGDRQMESNVLGSLALTALRLGDPGAAEGMLRESASLVVSLGITFSLPAALEQYAQLATAMGRWPDAARLWGAAEALRDSLRTPLEPFARPALDAWLAHARERLGVRGLTEAWAEGRSWPADRAMAWALRTRFVSQDASLRLEAAGGSGSGPRRSVDLATDRPGGHG